MHGAAFLFGACFILMGMMISHEGYDRIGIAMCMIGGAIIGLSL